MILPVKQQQQPKQGSWCFTGHMMIGIAVDLRHHCRTRGLILQALLAAVLPDLLCCAHVRLGPGL